MNTKTLIAMSLVAAASLGGCAQHQILIENPSLNVGEPTAVVAMNDTVSDTEALSIWGEILEELIIQQHQLDTQTNTSGMPQLVAGDWLAFECAMAGGYWERFDTEIDQKNDAPVFAEASESWLPAE